MSAPSSCPHPGAPPPCLPCSTYNLLNWQRLDAAGPVQLGNIACLHNFLGGIDEEWFRLVHVQIEQQAAAAVTGLPASQAAAAAGDSAGVRAALEAVTAALVDMQVGFHKRHLVASCPALVLCVSVAGTAAVACAQAWAPKHTYLLLLLPCLLHLLDTRPRWGVWVRSATRPSTISACACP